MIKTEDRIQTRLFETPGKDNTQSTVEIAKINADALGITKIVIASTWGNSIQAALNVFDPKKYSLICVTHNNYFQDGVEQEFPAELKNQLEAKGVKFVTGTLAFSGTSSALLRKYQQFDTTSMFARLVRAIFSDGTKVTLEITMMACDAGKVKQGEDVIALAGSGTGSDTCCWITAQSSRYFDQLRVKAILAKPL